jgi:hypothetical protein
LSWLSDTTAAVALTDADIRAFVGPRADRYAHLWANCIAGTVMVPRFNVAALFGGPIWMGYRKLYGLTAVWFGLLVALTLTRSALFDDAASESAQAFVSAAGLAEGIAMSWVGNYAYLRKARRTVNEARATFPDSREREIRLRQRGGVTWLGLVVAPALGFVGTGIALALATKLFGFEFG